jgi:5-methylcytosine-specific restriction endonuclease McrA
MFDLFGNKPKRKSRKLTPAQKKKVAARQSWKCDNCGDMLDETYEVDHIVPLEDDGADTIDNSQALCPKCHRKKTGRDRLRKQHRERKRDDDRYDIVGDLPF